MTGPILAGLTQSFLDAINSGAVPTISSSWQVGQDYNYSNVAYVG
jgi:hypothetical protein